MTVWKPALDRFGRTKQCKLFKPFDVEMQDCDVGVGRYDIIKSENLYGRRVTSRILSNDMARAAKRAARGVGCQRTVSGSSPSMLGLNTGLNSALSRRFTARFQSSFLARKKVEAALNTGQSRTMTRGGSPSILVICRSLKARGRTLSAPIMFARG
jgi:hypothetical protein